MRPWTTERRWRCIARRPEHAAMCRRNDSIFRAKNRKLKRHSQWGMRLQRPRETLEWSRGPPVPSI